MMTANRWPDDHSEPLDWRLDELLLGRDWVRYTVRGSCGVDFYEWRDSIPLGPGRAADPTSIVVRDVDQDCLEDCGPTCPDPHLRYEVTYPPHDSGQPQPPRIYTGRDDLTAELGGIEAYRIC